ncbi:MAG: CPBP family intramembrane metalloprotease [Nitrospirae bacterium]|nr:CPBP family intramembrane metalloprotease [Nitrospirota bacterium]
MTDTIENIKQYPNRPWPIKDIIFGIGIFIAFDTFGYILFHSDFFKYRPWISFSLYYPLNLIGVAILLLYPLYICKKRGFWPLLKPVTSGQFLKEIILSFFLLLLIVFCIGIIAILIEVVLNEKLTDEWKWIHYGPNNTLKILFLIMGFTLAPVAEELFFRGFLYNAFKTRLPISLAAVIQAVLFAIIHPYSLANRFLIFLIGIALVIVYEKRKTLLSPIIVHGIKNAFPIIPLVVLTVQNLHTPAQDWNEAMKRPEWFESSPPSYVERKKDGMQQWQYAIDTWGSGGSKQWKKEVNAFNAVCFWFPEDSTACAKAKLGIVHIYHYYLNDYRRAIIETDDLLSKYPDLRETAAAALSIRGWAYYMLKDFQKSRESFDRIINEFKEHKSAIESAQKGQEWLNAITKD